jgi:5-methylcytosine-specific restriction endonuclease McrA
MVSKRTKNMRNLRRKAIEKLGGKCVRCGYSDDARALTFDHKDGKGHIERKGVNPSFYQRKLYHEIIAGEREDIQLLCANCNQIKEIEEREFEKGSESR